MNTYTPTLLNLDFTSDANGNINGIIIQPDATKGYVCCLVNVEDANANARYLALTAKGVKNAGQQFDAQALASALESIRRGLVSDDEKARLLAAAQVTFSTSVVDQVP